MFKRIRWKSVLILITWLVSLGGLIALMSFIGIRKNLLICQDVKIIIPGTSSFIDRQEINSLLLKAEGTLVGKPVNDINIHHIENVLKGNPYIRDAKVYTDMDGAITIEIAQREPVLRILNYTSQDFYVDKDGYKIPSSLSYTPRVPVANGFIMESFSGRVDTLKTEVARNLYRTALFIQKDSLWNEQIEEMYVNDQKEIELIPRVGDQRILLGDADSLDIRFNNLKVFYRKVIPQVGWNAYKTINIKYCNQIVCEKNAADSNIVGVKPEENYSSEVTKNTEDN